MTVINRLRLTIQTLDNDGVPQLDRDVGFIQYMASVGEFGTRVLAVGANVIALPVTPALQLYVKNLHATQTVTVILTPQGGASATVHVLAPGAVLAIWEPATAGTYGFTALTLTASGAATPVELFIGG